MNQSTNLPTYQKKHRPSNQPTTQVSEFITLDEKMATLGMRDLLIINPCASILAPDPRLLPSAVFAQTYNLYCVY